MLDGYEIIDADFHIYEPFEMWKDDLEQEFKQYALLALIEGGILERYPELKVGFLELGCGWLPYWLWRLDEEYTNLAWEVKENVKLKPSEYFRRQCFIAIEASEPYLEEATKYIGINNLIFGSDYPHMDRNPDVIQNVVALEAQISPESLKQILWDNPARFYRVNSSFDNQPF